MRIDVTRQLMPATYRRPWRNDEQVRHGAMFMAPRSGDVFPDGDLSDAGFSPRR
jgi:hypothetical protein